MNKIKRVRLFVNDNIRAKNIAKTVKEKLEQENFVVVDDSFDLGIAIGGDGAFLRMIKATNFNSDVLFVGINAGTLGFAQEVSVDEVDLFIKSLRTKNYTYEEIGVQEVEVTTRDSVSKFYSLNEVVIRDDNLNTLELDILVDGVLLENYVGDGILVATSFGSTAYNLSFGGSIVYNTFHTLQITPIAPLNNKSYRNLINSVIIPSTKVISLIPIRNEKNLLVTVDGGNNFYSDVLKVRVFMKDKTIKVIRKSDYNFVSKINEKFLK